MTENGSSRSFSDMLLGKIKSPTRNDIIGMIRWASVLIVIVIMIAGSASGRMSKTPVTEVCAAVEATADLTDMVAGDDAALRRIYGLDPAEFDGYILFSPKSNMDAEEILIIKLTDKSQKQAVEDAFTARLEAQKNSFEGYGIEQFDLLTNNSVAKVVSGFGVFIVHGASADIYSAVKGAL